MALRAFAVQLSGSDGPRAWEPDPTSQRRPPISDSADSQSPRAPLPQPILLHLSLLFVDGHDRPENLLDLCNREVARVDIARLQGDFLQNLCI